MMTPATKICVTGRWADIVHALQEQVGPLLHSNPIIFWQGRGWRVERIMHTVDSPDYEIKFDSDKQAVLFALRWQG